MPINCGALAENTIESELFGHRRGAFTDAKTEAAGLIGEADGGTLFLDEVDALPAKAQAALLRMPALRERDNDVLELARAFLERLNRQYHAQPPRQFHPEFIEFMRRYPWPGNVREMCGNWKMSSSANSSCARPRQSGFT